MAREPWPWVSEKKHGSPEKEGRFRGSWRRDPGPNVQALVELGKMLEEVRSRLLQVAAHLNLHFPHRGAGQPGKRAIKGLRRPSETGGGWSAAAKARGKVNVREAQRDETG